MERKKDKIKTKSEKRKDVYLSNMKMKEAREEARKRWIRHRKKNSKDGTIITDSLGADLLGMIGEYAFGEYYNLPVDTTWRPFGDDGWDFMVGYNDEIVTIDTKITRNDTDPILRASYYRKKRPDIYFLISSVANNLSSLNNCKFHLEGWCWAKDLLVEERKKKRKYDKKSYNYVMHNRELNEPFEKQELYEGDVSEK